MRALDIIKSPTFISGLLSGATGVGKVMSSESAAIISKVDETVGQFRELVPYSKLGITAKDSAEEYARKVTNVDLTLGGVEKYHVINHPQHGVVEYLPRGEQFAKEFKENITLGDRIKSYGPTVGMYAAFGAATPLAADFLTKKLSDSGVINAIIEKKEKIFGRKLSDQEKAEVVKAAALEIDELIEKSALDEIAEDQNIKNIIEKYC